MPPRYSWRQRGGCLAITFVSIVLAVLMALSVAPAAAQSSLPVLTACTPETAPVLPSRWRAVGLMMPYQRQQLEVGEFVGDTTLPAMRATLYGVEQGAVDLLITENETYQLTGPRDAPSGCIALGRKYTPPGQRWLAENAVCDGEAPLASTKLQWWKHPAADGRAVRHWYKSDTRLPWRLLFPGAPAASELAVFGDYSMTNFASFTPLDRTDVGRTDLGQLAAFCAQRATKASAAAAAVTSARELMASAGAAAEAERAKRVETLIPGFTRKACATMAKPRWPDQFVVSGILLPIPMQYTPLPSVIFYDFTGAGTQVAMMHEARTQPPALELVSVLARGIGYGLEKMPNGQFACFANSPGVVRPDWISVAGCECKGVLDKHPELSPGDVTQILACPVKDAGLRVNWAWYTADSRPVLFMQPDAIGGGLSVADYHRWRPGMKMPADTFELPQECSSPPPMAPPVGDGMSASASAPCSDCHTTQR